MERWNRVAEGDVEFTSGPMQTGEQRARFRVAVRSQRTERPVEVGPMTLTQFRQMGTLADRIWEAGGAS